MIGDRRWGWHNHRCSFPPFSLMCSFFFSGLATCQVEGEKNQPQQKKRFDTDLLASTLKDYFVLALYPSTNIPFGCFFIILRLQTCCLRAFYTACQRRLLTPEHMADRGSLFGCPKSSLALLRALSLKRPPRVAGSRSQALGGQRSLTRTMVSH